MTDTPASPLSSTPSLSRASSYTPPYTPPGDADRQLSVSSSEKTFTFSGKQAKIGLSLIMYAVASTFMGITMKDCYEKSDKGYIWTLTIVSTIIAFLFLIQSFRIYRRDKKVSVLFVFLIVLGILLLGSAVMIYYTFTQLSGDCPDESQKRMIRISAFLNMIATIISSHAILLTDNLFDGFFMN